MARNATLIISQPGHRTRRVELSGGVASIGRAAGNAVCLKDDSSVSRYHAVIADRADGFWLSDLGTRNGTTVNNNSVESEQMLEDGDLICLGGASTIEFCSPGAEESGPSAAVAAAPATAPSTTSEKAALEDASPGADAPTPTPPASGLSGGGSLVTVLGVIGGLAMTALIVGVLFATGVFSGKKSRRPVSNSAELQTQTDPIPFDGGGDHAPSATPEPTETPDLKEAPNVQPSPASIPAAGSEAIAGAAQVMAAKISPKNYRIDPAFAVLIGSYVSEYRGAAGYFGRARTYRDAIDKEFVNTQGLPPLFGYVMAMSRSKFVEGGGGVWQLPLEVVKGEAADASGVGLSKPASSTKVAASYIRGLWDIFGREGFMYTVACYGMTADEAGAVQQQLESKDPTGQARYDFWRMKNAGVLKGDQVERVARFFAAGIVAENPQQFGLNEQPLSSLY
jgi:hypothetical protein